MAVGDSTFPNPACSECGALIPENRGIQHCPNCLLKLALTVEFNGGEVSPDASRAGLPETFGNYELLEVLGEGGMGIVYKARQKKLQRVVALKLIRSGSFASASEIRRFRTEAKAAADLSHPNLVPIHDVEEESGQIFFSMEFVDGPTLAQVIQRTPLPPEQGAGYVRIIAEAIHYAHERGIVHRDLKPANVLIDGRGQPRVTDFGLAKHLKRGGGDGNSEPEGSTQPGAVLGTPSYMSPEQALGGQLENGALADVYSLGAILYDCLTGRPPFRADTPVATLNQVIETEPAPPRLLNPKIPRDLETICLKCLAKKPEQRYQSARELADDLGRYLNHEPILARPVRRVERLWRWTRRKPALAGLLLAVGVMFLLLDVAALVLRNKIHGLTVFSAQQSAKVISSELQLLANQVAEVARDTNLVGLFQSTNTNAMQTFLQDTIQSINKKPGLKWMGGTPFESGSLYNAQGDLWAREPEAQYTNSLDRDHFQGSRKNAPAPYISKVFRSRTDTKEIIDKFGVSVAIRQGKGNQEKTVGVLLATVTTSSTRTLRNLQNNAEIVLVGPIDPTDPSEVRKPWAIISHPAYTPHSSEAIRIDRDQLPYNLESQGRSLYFDPVSSQYPLYSGPWLAGVARIKGTQFYVIVQTRDHVVSAVATAAVVTAASMILFFCWRFARRQAIRRRSEQQVR